MCVPGRANKSRQPMPGVVTIAAGRRWPSMAAIAARHREVSHVPNNDYSALKAGHTVVDVRQKTIT